MLEVLKWAFEAVSLPVVAASLLLPAWIIIAALTVTRDALMDYICRRLGGVPGLLRWLFQSFMVILAFIGSTIFCAAAAASLLVYIDTGLIWAPNFERQLDGLFSGGIGACGFIGYRLLGGRTSLLGPHRDLSHDAAQLNGEEVRCFGLVFTVVALCSFAALKVFIMPEWGAAEMAGLLAFSLLIAFILWRLRFK